MISIGKGRHITARIHKEIFIVCTNLIVVILLSLKWRTIRQQPVGRYVHLAVLLHHELFLQIFKEILLHYFSMCVKVVCCTFFF
jgi:hypothetical protein